MATIEQKIEALQLARAYVERGEPYICGILSGHVVKDRPDLKAACHYLASYTSAQVSYDWYTTLNNYLAYHAGVKVKQRSGLYVQDYDERMRVTRLAWIDWMINCYQEDLANKENTDEQNKT